MKVLLGPVALRWPICELQVAVDRSVCPDIQWCYRLYYKSRQARRTHVHSTPSVTPDVYTMQQIEAAERSLRQCVDDWCERIRQSPHLLVPVIERLASESQQVTVIKSLVQCARV